jgi:hypothetical protein
MFIDSSGGAVIQQGPSPTYTLTAADVGRSIQCQVLAGNAGGTGVGQTGTAGPVRPSRQEEEAAKKRHEEEEQATARRQREAEEVVRKKGEEEATAARKKLAEEEATKRAAEAAAAKKHEEEIAHGHGEEAKGEVLGTQETSKSSASHLTRVQLLTKALAVCKKQPKRRRAQCAARARRRYGGRRSRGKKK